MLSSFYLKTLNSKWQFLLALIFGFSLQGIFLPNWYRAHNKNSKKRRHQRPWLPSTQIPLYPVDQAAFYIYLAWNHLKPRWAAALYFKATFIIFHREASELSLWQQWSHWTSMISESASDTLRVQEEKSYWSLGSLPFRFEGLSEDDELSLCKYCTVPRITTCV